jgi:O-antigen/teichoic acid export membrane protein
MYSFLLDKDVNPLDVTIKKKITQDVKALAIYKIGTISLNSTDNIIMSKMVGILSVGYYSNYNLLCSSVTGFLSTIFGNITASIGNHNAVSSTAEKLQMFFNINFASFALYTIASACLYNCMSPFINLWVGDEYVMDQSIPFIMVINLYIGSLLFASYNYRQTMGLFVQGKLRPIISAILNIVLSIILAKYYGVLGILMGTAITRLTTNVWYDPYIVFKRGLGVSPLIYFKDFLIKTITFVAIIGICHLIAILIPQHNLLDLILLCIASFIVSTTLIVILFFRTKEFAYLYSVAKNLRNILKSK